MRPATEENAFYVLCTYRITQNVTRSEQQGIIAKIYDIFDTNGWKNELSESADGTEGGQFGFVNKEYLTIVAVNKISDVNPSTGSREIEIIIQVNENKK